MSTALRTVGLLAVLSSTRTVEYACGALGRALLAKRRIPARLRRLPAKPGEKSGLDSLVKDATDRALRILFRSELHAMIRSKGLTRRVCVSESSHQSDVAAKVC